MGASSYREKPASDRRFFQTFKAGVSILFDTARERARRSAMEGLGPAKKLGHPSTRPVRAFVT